MAHRVVVLAHLAASINVKRHIVLGFLDDAVKTAQHRHLTDVLYYLQHAIASPQP